MRRILIASLAVLALALAGCGGSEFEGGTPEDQIRELLADFAGAIEDGDPEAACAPASPDSLEQLGGVEGCRQAVSRAMEDTSQAQLEDLADPASIEIEDDEATILYERRPAGTAQLVGDRWMIGPGPDAADPDDQAEARP